MKEILRKNLKLHYLDNHYHNNNNMIMLLLYQNRSTVDNTFLLAQLLTVSIVLHPFILDKCYFWNSIDARTRFVSLKRHQIALRGPFSLQQRVDLMCISYALPVCIRMLLLIRVLLVCSRYVTCMLLVRIRVVRMYPHVTRICYPYVPAWCFSQDI